MSNDISSQISYDICQVASLYDLETYLYIKKLEGKWKSFYRIDIYPDEITISTYIGKLDSAKKDIRQLLHELCIEKDSEIYVHIGDTDIPLVFEEDDDEEIFESKYPFRPLLKDIALISDELSPDTLTDEAVAAPCGGDGLPSLTAFFSFKGGVGRTMHLAALCRYMSKKCGSSFESPNILLVDADTEAPGLTWWAEDALTPSYSYLDFLSGLLGESEALPERAASRIRTMRLELGGTKQACFFLPAFRNQMQLLRPPATPERLTLSGKRPWILTDALFSLARELGVKHVFVDLRAGLTELSAPLLYDPRIRRVLVTTTSFQSVRGTVLTLSLIKKFSSLHLGSLMDSTRILTSFIPANVDVEQRLLDIEEQFDAFMQANPADSNNPPVAYRSWIVRSPFDQNLLGLGGIKATMQALAQSSQLDAVCEALAPSDEDPKEEDAQAALAAQQHALAVLSKKTEALMYAENQEKTFDFLVIEPYRRLISTFSSSTPNAVIFGMKGSGKTFFAKTLAHLGSWKSFCKKCSLDNVLDATIIPILWSQNESDASKHELTKRQIEAARHAGYHITENDILESQQIAKNLFAYSDNAEPSYWRNAWFRYFCLSLHIDTSSSSDCEQTFKEALQRMQTPFVLLLDGLEDLFAGWLARHVPVEPLRVLLQDILRGIPLWQNSGFGILAFLRKDIVRRAITQNSEQYISLFKQYEIKWSKEEALRLVGWLLAGDLRQYRSGIDDDAWEACSFDAMSKALVPLWGLKLGQPASNEAYTANWVLSAISDFNGNFQARDIMRFLHFASTTQPKQYFQPDRLLTPGTIRSVLSQCGSEKISEMKQEMTEITNDLDKLGTSQLSVPLTRSELQDLGLASVSALEGFGILLCEGDSFYLPEMYRQGLRIGIKGGARPKVVALMKRAWARAGA